MLGWVVNNINTEKVEPPNKGHLGPMSFIRRLSSSQRLEMSYCDGRCVQMSVLCWEVVPFFGGSFIREYRRGETAKRVDIGWVTWDCPVSESMESQSFHG